MTPDQLLSKLETLSLRDLDAKQRWETLEQIKSAHKASARKHAPSGLEMERRIKLLRHWQTLVRLYAEDKQLGEPVVEALPETVTEETESDHEGEAWVRVRVLAACVIRGVQLTSGHVIDLTPHDLEELLARGVVEVFSEVTEETVEAETLPVEALQDETPPPENAPDVAEPVDIPPDGSQQDETQPDEIMTAPAVPNAEVSAEEASQQAVETEISEPVAADAQLSEPVEAEIVAAPEEESAPDQVADAPEIQMVVETPRVEAEESVADDAPEAAALDGIFAVMDEAEYGPKLPDLAMEVAPLEAVIQEQVVPEISGSSEASLPAKPPEPEFFDLPSFPFLPKKALKAEPEPEPVPAPEPEPEPKPFPKIVFKSELKVEKAPEIAVADVVEPEPEPEPEPSLSEAPPRLKAQVVGIFDDRAVRSETDEPVSAPPPFVPGEKTGDVEAVKAEPEAPAIPLDEALARLERRPKLPPGYHNKRADELEREAAVTVDPAFKRQLLDSAEKFRKMALSAARGK